MWGPCVLLDGPPEALDKRDCVFAYGTHTCTLALACQQLHGPACLWLLAMAWL
jgi:hypothetical protein